MMEKSHLIDFRLGDLQFLQTLVGLKVSLSEPTDRLTTLTQTSDDLRESQRM